jgi:PadR family transcriptional regulator, regulatory protein AphA
MHLEHAILGFLIYQSFTGYELKRLFDQSIRHFWPADQSQIYKTLSKLAEKGYASVEVIHQEDRPSRKVYHITDEGKKAFMDWVGRTPDGEVFREPFLIQVFFSGLLSDEDTLRILEAKSDELGKTIKHLTALGKDDAIDKESHEAPPRDQFFWYLTLDHGLWMMQAAQDWLEDTVWRIRNKEYALGPRVLPPPKRTRSKDEHGGPPQDSQNDEQDE